MVINPHTCSTGMLSGTLAKLCLSQLFLFGVVRFASAEESDPTTWSLSGFHKAFGQSLAVILATEIGDRTFFIAAIMAMRHSRLVVWGGAVGAL